MEEEKINNSLRTAAGCVSIALLGVILLPVGFFLLAVIVFPGTSRGSDYIWTIVLLILVCLFIIYLISQVISRTVRGQHKQRTKVESFKETDVITTDHESITEMDAVIIENGSIAENEEQNESKNGFYLFIIIAGLILIFLTYKLAHSLDLM